MDAFRTQFEAVSEVGYANFREEYLDAPEMVSEFPDPAARERELRRVWDSLAETEYQRLTSQEAPATDAITAEQQIDHETARRREEGKDYEHLLRQTADRAKPRTPDRGPER